MSNKIFNHLFLCLRSEIKKSLLITIVSLEKPTSGFNFLLGCICLALLG